MFQSYSMITCKFNFIYRSIYVNEDFKKEVMHFIILILIIN